MKTKTLRVLAGASALSLALAASSAWAQTKMEMPKYGGTLEISTIYPTISALSFDSYDWPWKHNHDTGAIYEQLFATDLSKAKSRGGKVDFVSDAYIPSHLSRGELAEKWEWLESPLRLKITMRKGVMFPEKPGVMASRVRVTSQGFEAADVPVNGLVPIQIVLRPTNFADSVGSLPRAAPNGCRLPPARRS